MSNVISNELLFKYRRLLFLRRKKKPKFDRYSVRRALAHGKRDRVYVRDIIVFRRRRGGAKRFQ